MNRKLLYTALVILLALNLLLAYNLFAAKSSNSKDPDTTGETLLKLSKLYHSDNVVNAQLNNNTQLNKDIVLTDITGATTTISQLVGSGTKLILRSTEDGCGLCIETELGLIKKHSKLIGAENIVVITTHSNIRKLQVFQQTNSIPFKIFICNDLGMPYEKETNKPFIFTLDHNLVAQNFFIPEVTLSGISEDYYNAIYNRHYAAKAH